MCSTKSSGRSCPEVFLVPRRAMGAFSPAPPTVGAGARRVRGSGSRDEAAASASASGAELGQQGRDAGGVGVVRRPERAPQVALLEPHPDGDVAGRRRGRRAGARRPSRGVAQKARTSPVISGCRTRRGGRRPAARCRSGVPGCCPPGLPQPGELEVVDRERRRDRQHPAGRAERPQDDRAAPWTCQTCPPQGCHSTSSRTRQMSVARTYVVRSSDAGIRRRSHALTSRRAITECWTANSSRRARSTATATAVVVRAGPSTVRGTTTPARKATVHSVTTTNPTQATADRSRETGCRGHASMLGRPATSAQPWNYLTCRGSRATYQAATWERDLNPRRSRIRSRCDSADRSVMPRRSASSRFVRPSATRAATSVWRGVRLVGTARRSRGQPEEAPHLVDHGLRIAHGRKVRAALELHQLGARDRVGEGPALRGRSRSVSAPVQHQGRRGDPGEGGTHVEVVGEAEQRDRRLGRGGRALVLGQRPAGAGVRLGREEVGEQVGAQPPVRRQQPEQVPPAVLVADRVAGGPAAVQHQPRDRLRVGPPPTARPPRRPATSPAGRSASHRAPRSRPGSWPARAPWSEVPRRGPRGRTPAGRSAPGCAPTTAPRGTCARPGWTSPARDG